MRSHLMFCRRATVITLMLLSATLLSCAPQRDGGLFGPSDAGILLVDGLLFVDQPLPPIYLRRTLDPDGTYSPLAAAVPGALVELFSGTQTYIYSADPDSVGRYLPPADVPLVSPQTTYGLRVEVDDESLTATTLTPPRLRLREAVRLDEETLEVKVRMRTFAAGSDSVYTAPENRLRYLDDLVELRFEPLDAVAYQLALFSLDPDSEFIIDADFLEEDDIADFERQGSSPPLDIDDGRARLPWFAVAWEGRHLFKVLAIDQNWFDYVRTNPEESGGFAAGGLAGDNFERPIFSVVGGIGLFGSASVDSVGFFVSPR
jgi:hypothetical protein